MVTILKTETFGDIPVRLTITGLKRFEEKTGRHLFSGESTLGDLPISDLEYLFYVAAKKGARTEKTEFAFEYGTDEHEDLFDEIYLNFLKAMPAMFGDMSGKTKEEIAALKEQIDADVPSQTQGAEQEAKN